MKTIDQVRDKHEEQRIDNEDSETEGKDDKRECEEDENGTKEGIQKAQKKHDNQQVSALVIADAGYYRGRN